MSAQLFQLCVCENGNPFLFAQSAQRKEISSSLVPSSMKPFKQVKYHHQTPFVSINNTFFLVSSIFLCHHQQVVSFRFTSSNAVHHWWLTLSLLSCASSLHFSFHFFIPFFSGYYFGIIHKETRTKQHDGLGSEFGADGIVKKFVEKRMEARMNHINTLIKNAKKERKKKTDIRNATKVYQFET